MVRVSRDDERLRMMADLLERLPAAVAYLAGPDHTFEFANDTYLALIGRTDVLGKPAAEALPEAVEQDYLEMLEQVLTTGRPTEVREAELRVRRNGDERAVVFVDLLYEPVHDDDRVVGVLVHAVDVTGHVLDRRRAEALAAEIEEAQGRYRTLFETMLLGVVYHGSDGTIVAANPMAGQKLGVDPEDLVGLSPEADQWQAVHEDGSPFPGHDHPAMVALRTGEIVADVVMGVTHGRTGERRWLSVTAVPNTRDEQGRPQSVYAMYRDITVQRQAEAALRERDGLLGRLRDANVLGILLVDEGGIVDANDAFLQMLGYSPDDVAGGRIDWRSMTPPEWQAKSAAAVEEIERTGVCRPFEKEYLHRDGGRVPVLVGSALVQRDPLRWVTFVADLSERQRAEEERARLLASAQAAMAEAENAGERLGLLLRAGALVTATRDRDDLLRHATRLVVPAFADFALVFLHDEGDLVADVGEHRDPDGTAFLESIRGYRVATTSSMALGIAFLTGRSQLVDDVVQRTQDMPWLEPASRDIAARLMIDSLIAVPLVQDTTRLGVLALGRTPGRVPFTQQDVAVAEELGRRLAVGLTHAETSAREHTVAEMLQRSVLPDVLPSIPGVDLAVVYLPATEGVEVGGDWYDAFPLGEDRVGLALGDVVGHNLASASAMNQVRNALRAYAVDTPDPALVLERTNAALAQLMPDAMATVFYGVLDAGSGKLTYANAGHPPPLLIGPRGPTYLTGGAGLMLGVSDRAEYTASSEHLEVGCAVLLYSDGLVEDRRRSLDQGLEALAGAFRDGGQVTAAELCATAQATMIEGQVRADDVCLLAVQLVK